MNKKRCLIKTFSAVQLIVCCMALALATQTIIITARAKKQIKLNYSDNNINNYISNTIDSGNIELLGSEYIKIRDKGIKYIDSVIGISIVFIIMTVNLLMWGLIKKEKGHRTKVSPESRD